MDVFIDGEGTVLPTEEVGTFRDLFRLVDKIIEAQGRCVTEMKIDGRPMATGDIDETTLLSVDAVQRVEFITEQTSRLVEDLVGELASQIDELGQLVRQLAGKFQEDAGIPPIDALPKMVDAWQGVLDRLMTAADLMRLDIDTIELSDGETAGGHHAKLSETLGRLTAAVAQQDHVLVADLLEYEVAPGIERETSILAALRHAASQADQD
jgi:hypothetical protein